MLLAKEEFSETSKWGFDHIPDGCGVLHETSPYSLFVPVGNSDGGKWWLRLEQNNKPWLIRGDLPISGKIVKINPVSYNRF